MAKRNKRNRRKLNKKQAQQEQQAALQAQAEAKHKQPEEQQPEEQQITLVDDQGNEELYTVLLMFESEDMGKSYILVYPAGKDASDDDVEVEAYSLPKGEDPADPQGGKLMPIDSETEWDMVESVLNTFLENETKQ